MTGSIMSSRELSYPASTNRTERSAPSRLRQEIGGYARSNGVEADVRTKRAFWYVFLEKFRDNPASVEADVREYE